MRKSWMVVAVVVAILVVAASTIAAAKPPGGGTGRQVVERTITVTLPPGIDFFDVDELVSCPSGAASVNGGFAWLNPPPSQGTERRVAGGPDGTAWRVVARNLFADPGSTNTFTLWAICVNA
jgi:hypothetical protein